MAEPTLSESALAAERLKKVAMLMLLGSSTLFGVMAFTAKLASDGIPGSQVAMIRFVISLIPFLVFPRAAREAMRFQRLDLLFYRGFFGGVAVLFYFVAISHIPVGVATLLNYTAPIFSGFFAAMFLGERVRFAVFAPLLIAFTGVFLVVRSHAAPGELIGFGRWELLGLSSAMLSGAAVTAIRSARKTEGSWAIFGSFALFGLLATAPFGIAQWRTPTAKGWILLLIMGAVSIAAQLLMTHALKWIDTVSSGVISQFAVVVSMGLGALFIGEGVNALTIAGSALTIGGVIVIMAITSRPRPSAFDEAPEQ
jgi:drug/metabolite transporter (DMT)-like permease